MSLTRRRRVLDRVVPATTTVLSRVFAVEGRGRDLFAAAERLDWRVFHLWADHAAKEFPNGLIPIYWYIETPNGNFEFAPFQYAHDPDLEHPDFLTYFTWPTHVATGEPLNWLTLPVVDKLWRRGSATKGGFIQEFTGWKPSTYQPFVCLDTLRAARAPA